MSIEEKEQLTWLDSLTRRFCDYRSGRNADIIAEAIARNALVVKVRWLILVFIGIYVLLAGSVFLFSSHGLFLNTLQKAILITSALSVVCYNLIYQYCYNNIQKYRFANHLQIFLDIVFVTILIHVSGGVASWFWPVYLVVTIESAFLLEKRWEVWALGAIGGACYGSLLLMEYIGIVEYVKMPFVAGNLQQDFLYMALRWLWAAFLNTVTAIITTFLMGVIRTEANLLRESEERLLSFIEAANDLIFSTAPDGRFIYANCACCKVLGYDRDKLITMTLSDLIPANFRRSCSMAFAHALKYGSSETIDTSLLTQDGNLVPVEGNLTCSYSEDRPMALWWICRDITERKLAQEQLYHLAHFDLLTGLPNRALLNDRLKLARALAFRGGMSMAVFFLDLDRFKIINDTLGHPVGDKLLQSVARRLSSCIREIDTAARIGGDEFLIVLINIRNSGDADMVASKVLKTLAAPHYIDEHELYVTTSIGISVYPSDDENLDNLIKKADIAMYSAKSSGSNTYRFYDSSMDENAHKRFILENSLRKGLEDLEFQIYYQPKMEITTGEITAFEALLRWNHPDLGLLAPAEFIPLAEETGLINSIGEWVLREACIQNAMWHRQGLNNLRVAVNVSGHQLRKRGFAESVIKILEEVGLAGEHLELEIKESVIMQNPDFISSVIEQLREKGIQVSIDDFGKGYSSLSNLKHFSVNTLKIDKSFLRDVESDTADAAIATALITMGSSLNLRVIAEGVETEGQLEFLRMNLCDEMQGYYFSRPMPASGVLEFMRGKKVKQPEQE